jgi:hypothetical protein
MHPRQRKVWGGIFKALRKEGLLLQNYRKFACTGRTSAYTLVDCKTRVMKCQVAGGNEVPGRLGGLAIESELPEGWKCPNGRALLFYGGWDRNN